MRCYKIWLLCLVLCLSMALLSCSQQPLALQTLQGNDTPLSDLQICLQVGQQQDIALSLDGQSIEVQVLGVSPLAHASVDGNLLTLVGKKQGSGSISLKITGQNGRENTVELPFEVQLPSWEFSVTEQVVNPDGTKYTQAIQNDALQVAKGKTTFLLLEGEGASFDVQCDDSRIDVQLENDLIKLSGQETLQNARLTITAQKEGYQPAQKTLLVTVGDPALQVQISTSNLDLVEPSMELDASSAITLKTTPSQADISAQVADESILRAEVVNNHVLLYAQKLGKTTLTITARQEGYAPYETKLEIEVTGQKTPFAVEDTVLRVEAGGQAEIPFELLQGAELALEYDKSLYSVSIQENRLLVKGLAPGQGVLRIRAQHEEYAPRVRSVNVIVSKPKLSFENLPQTLSVQHGGSYMLPVKVSESGAEISVMVSQNIAQVSVVAGQIYIQGQSAGQAVLMVTASKDGYEEVTQSISLSVYNQTMECPISHESITVVASQSENIQVYPPEGCRISVHSNSPLISTSVQGNTITVYSKGEAGHAQLTVTVSKPGYYNVNHTVQVEIIA